MPAGESKQFRWSQSVPADWVDAIDRRCQQLGVTRTEYVRSLLLADQPERTAKKLSEPQRAGRPPAAG